jgi:hypothetical protein
LRQRTFGERTFTRRSKRSFNSSGAGWLAGQPSDASPPSAGVKFHPCGLEMRRALRPWTDSRRELTGRDPYAGMLGFLAALSGVGMAKGVCTKFTSLTILNSRSGKFIPSYEKCELSASVMQNDYLRWQGIQSSPRRNRFLEISKGSGRNPVQLFSKTLTESVIRPTFRQFPK